MGSALGVRKAAATRLGISLAEYDQRRQAEKWCTSCKAWHPHRAFPVDRSRGDGRRARCTAADRGKPRIARDPQREAARHAVGYAVRQGRLPNPNTVPCMDCAHEGSDRRHEYDHHLGYEDAHWLDVEPVCTTCHADREKGRR